MEKDLVLLKADKDAEAAANVLGFSALLFLERDIVHLTGANKAALLQAAQKARQQKLPTVYRASDPETLRFVLEKVPVDFVYGLEQLHDRDSLHYPRSGLDHVLCKIAADEGKTIAFAFSELLHDEKNRALLLRRMAFNIRLCKKYKVKMLLGSFATQKEELRSRKDLEAFFRLLERFSF